jgi:hypothetical protein
MAGGTRLRHEHGEVLDAERGGLRHRQGIGGCRRFEADGEEHDLPIRVLLREADRVQRRIDDSHIRPLRFQPEEIRVGPRDSQHVAERGERHAGPARDGMGLVDLLQRRHTHGTSGSVHELDLRRQHPVHAVLDDRVGLAAADLHEGPRPCGHPPDLGEDLGRDPAISILVQVLHAGPSGMWISSSCPSSSRNR